MEAGLSELNWFDILVISIVSISALLAFFKGFIKTIFSFITWVGALVATAYSYPYSSAYFAENVESEKVALTLSLVGVFLVYFFVFALINGRFVFMLRKIRWGVVDRTFGFAFGVLRGSFVVCVMFFALTMTSSLLERDPPGFVADAQTHNALKIGTTAMLTFVPDEAVEHLASTVEESFNTISSVLAGDIMEGVSPEEREEEGGASLTDEDRKVMKKIISALPRETLEALQQKYKGRVSELDDLQRMQIFNEIFAAYADAVAQGTLGAGNEISPEELEALGQALKGERISSEPKIIENETGYKKFNIQQFDRLINNL